MAIVFVDGFDYYPIANITRKWTAGAASSMQTGVYAGNCVRFNGTNNNISKAFTAAATIGVSFYLRIFQASAAATAICIFKDTSTTHVDVRIDANYKLYATRNGTTLGSASTNALSLNTWYHVEIKTLIDDSAGTVEVRINGTNSGWLNLTSQDTRNAGNASVNTINLAPGSSSYFDYDHLVIWNTSGNAPTNFMGDTKVVTLYPSGDSGTNNAWTASTGSSKYACVDETQTSDTDYISSTTAGNIQTFTKGACDMATVRAVAINLVQEKDDASAYTIAELTRSGSTNYANATTVAPAASYVDSQWIRDQDPATSSAWTESGVDNAEFGVKHVT
jgi:hypothetical protein